MRNTIENDNEAAAEATSANATATVNQMELGFAGRRARARARSMSAANVRQRRAQRAQWWFAQMRRVVDRARDWQSAPPARHEQVYLTLAGRRN